MGSPTLAAAAEDVGGCMVTRPAVAAGELCACVHVGGAEVRRQV